MRLLLPSWRSPLAACLLVFAAAVVVLWTAERRVLRGKYTPPADADRFFAPYYILLADHVRAGQFMLWDPWTRGGLPACAYPEIGSYSPLTLLAAGLTGPTLRGFVFYWLGVWALGGLGMLILARHLGAPPWGALVVVLGFMFSGFFTGHAEHTSWIYSFAALPWIVWRLDVAVVQHRTLAAVEGGALWGLSAMAGYPGVVLATALTAGLWVLGRAIFPSLPSPSGRGAGGEGREDALHTAVDAPSPNGPHPSPLPKGEGTTTRLLRAVWLLAAWGMVGVIVMSPTYLTFLKETPGYTERAGALSRQRVTTDNALALRGLLSFGTPYVSTWAMVNNEWSYTDPSSVSLYLGMCVSWLALGALILQPRNAWRWWLVAMALAGIGLAMGRLLPLRGWLYDVFPPSRYFRHASIFGCITIFISCVLAALASADLAKTWRGRGRPRAAAMLVAGVLLAIAGIAAYCLAAARSPEAGLSPEEARLHACLGWTAVVLIALLGIAATRWPLGRTAFVAALCTLSIADALETARLTQAVTCYTDPDIAADWNRMNRQHPTSLDLAATTGLDRKPRVVIPPGVGVKHLVVKVPTLLARTSMDSHYSEQWTLIPVLRRAATGPRRIWFAPKAIEAPTGEDTFRAFCDRAVVLGAPPMVVHAPREMTHPSAAIPPDAVGRATAIAEAPAASLLDVHLRRYTPDTLAFDVDCPTDGWLLVTDRWAPGWQATVNGRPVPVYGGMWVFRAVQVRAGPNDVRFSYRPWGHPWLAIASYLTLGAVIVTSIRRRIKIS